MLKSILTSWRHKSCVIVAIIILGIHFSIPLIGSDIVVIKNDMNEYHLKKNDVDILQDSAGSLSFLDIIKPQYSKLFKSSELYDKGIQNSDVKYWLRFQIKNES